MAFLQRLQCISNLVARRHFCSHVQKSVFISQSNDIFTNLALEQWLQKNIDTRKHHVMLYYRNDPCLVLGKNDNPWTGSNVCSSPEIDVKVARRAYDAKIQYHDTGSANFTFFGHLAASYNLSIISRAIFRNFGVNLKHKKTNLTMYNREVSSNGSNMQEHQNYTLFVNVNKSDLKRVMKINDTSSYGKLLNLNELDSRITNGGLLTAIGWEFLRTHPYELKDGGDQRGFQLINPSEGWLPGIGAMRDKLSTWEWCYGATPKFSIYRTFQVPLELLNNANDCNELRVKISIEHGRIEDISLVVPPGLLTSGFTGKAQIVIDVRGKKFSVDALAKVEQYLGLDQCRNVREKFVTECVRNAMVI